MTSVVHERDCTLTLMDSFQIYVLGFIVTLRWLALKQFYESRITAHKIAFCGLLRKIISDK